MKIYFCDTRKGNDDRKKNNKKKKEKRNDLAVYKNNTKGAVTIDSTKTRRISCPTVRARKIYNEVTGTKGS